MLTLYYGPDSWRLRHAARGYADRWRDEHGTGLTVVDGSAVASHDELHHICSYPSLFQQKSGAAVYRPLEISDIQELLKEVPKDTDILLVQDTAQKQTIAQKQALKLLLKHCDATEIFEPLAGVFLSAWIIAFAKEHGKTIDTAAGAELTARAGNDTWQLANELEKLCAYAPEIITKDTVQLLVPPTHTHDQWELSNAIAAHDKRASVAALFRNVRGGVPEPLLVGTVASAIRTVLMVNDLHNRGSQAAEIAKKTGLHPYVVSKTLRGAQMYEPARLRQAHGALAALDRHAKEGKADAIDGLFGVLMAL